MGLSKPLVVLFTPGKALAMLPLASLFNDLNEQEGSCIMQGGINAGQYHKVGGRE